MLFCQNGHIIIQCWIDLIFGFKQQRQHAIDLQNVFHPLTYHHNVTLSEYKHYTSKYDIILKEAAIEQVRSFGQTPIQLFDKAHPNKAIICSNASELGNCGYTKRTYPFSEAIYYCFG